MKIKLCLGSKAPLVPVSAPGFTGLIAVCAKCGRFYPHRVQGELAPKHYVPATRLSVDNVTPVT